MARVKLSEWKAKQLLSTECGMSFASICIKEKADFAQFDKNKSYVVKVDQGVKKRFKNGLVKLDVIGSEIQMAVEELKAKGYGRFIVDPYIKYELNNERYLSLERVREGIRVMYSLDGGVNVEEQLDQIKIAVVQDISEIAGISTYLGIKAETLQGIYSSFNKNYLSFLEINPLVVTADAVYFLDAAGEVDNTAQFFVNSWTLQDVVTPPSEIYEEERQVASIAEQSQAALTLKVLNPDGAIFLLLSGGGASIVMADEIYDMGYGKEIANYGEYSGNPSTEETYLYTQSLLALLLKSKAKKKVLVIGGGVANFTDIRQTFKGVIKAMDEVSKKLSLQKIKVFVRRGGPYQEEGLQIMRSFLTSKNILGSVMGPDEVLTKAAILAVEYLKKG